MQRADFRAVNPNEVEFKLTMTLPLERWRKIRDVLQGNEWPLKEALDEMIRGADSWWSWEAPADISQGEKNGERG